MAVLATKPCFPPAVKGCGTQPSLRMLPSTRLDARPSVSGGCREVLFHLDWETMSCYTSTFSMSRARGPYSCPSPANPTLVQLPLPMSCSLHPGVSCFHETSWVHMFHHRATRPFLGLLFHRKCCLFTIFLR